ncbi:MAG TPA: LpqB family beta-propeller domain-containing protein [Gemmatimonadales bacterium]|nr:LpqB family beta-propeller domain-containing protein [Gemmatimonadales bacterium]
MPAARTTALMFLATALPGALLAQNAAPDTARQVTVSANYDPSLSPDGTRMVYISDIAGREQLVVRSLDGREVRQLTTDEADHEDPAWSPDGNTIAFVHLKDGHARIAIMPAAGGPAEILTRADKRVIHPSWSPDSRRIIYCADDDLKPPKKNPASVMVLDLASRQVRELISGGVNTYPVWSPDGRWIAFRRMVHDTNSEVFLADSAGRGARNLTNSPAFDGWPAWSPDGRLIAFASNRGGTGDYEIYVMKPDGSEVRRVARTSGRATAPKWGRDGRTLYFPICRREGCEIYESRVRAGDSASRSDAAAGALTRRRGR